MSLPGNTNGSATRPTTVDSVYSIALKIGETIIKGANIKSHYADFDKKPLEYGGIIESLRVKVKSATEFDPTNTTDSTAYDTIVKRYFGTWNPIRFDTEIARSYAKSVVTGETQLEDFVAKLINNLTESELLNTEKGYKSLLFSNASTKKDDCLMSVKTTDGSIAGYLGAASLYEHMAADVNGVPTKQEIFTEIRNIVKDMTYANTTYNATNIGENCTSIEDIRIVLPFRFMNEADVTFLSNLFNLEKADMMAKIVEVDGQDYEFEDANGDTHKGYGIFILSKDAIGRVVRGREMESEFVRERFSQWYGVHLEEMYYFNPTEKAFCILADNKFVAGA